MRTIVGVSLIVTGIAGQLAAVVIHLLAEADLFEKRPDLVRLQDEWGPLTRLKRWRAVTRAYNTEFPDGDKLRNYWIVTIAGVTSFLSGLGILTQLK